MTPLHLAVQSNRTKMVESLLDQGADFNLQDENKVILHTYEVDYFQLAGRCCIYCLVLIFFLLFRNKILSNPALKLGSDLWLG